MHQLIDNKSKFDYVVIETTGLADPTFTQSFFLSEKLKQHFYLDGIVTLVDAFHCQRHLKKRETAPKDPREIQIINEAMEQIAFADRIVINKTDLVNDEQLKELKETIHEINSTAELRATQYAQVELNFILDIQSFSIDRCLKQDPGFLDYRPFRQHDGKKDSLNLVPVLIVIL